jgi:hypothetical protein
MMAARNERNEIVYVRIAVAPLNDLKVRAMHRAAEWISSRLVRLARGGTMRRLLWTTAAIGAAVIMMLAMGSGAVTRSEGPGAHGHGPSCGDEVGRGPSYSTNFPLDELPISEGGAWSHVGTSWTFVQTENGYAHGTQTGQGGFDDSYARLSGFPPDQRACAVIHKSSPSISGEVEILLRLSDTKTTAKGYECFLHTNGLYAMIVRWNGVYGDFTSIAHVDEVTAPQDGDILKATAIGDVITLYLNDEILAQATDSTYPTGNPGIGFYKDEHGGAPTEYGFKSYSATGL